MALTPPDWRKRALFLGEPKIAGLDGANVQPAIYRPDSTFTGITDGLQPNLQFASTTGADVVGATDQAGITGPRTLYPSMWEDPKKLRRVFQEQEFADVQPGTELGGEIGGARVEIPGIGERVGADESEGDLVYKSRGGNYYIDIDGEFTNINDEVRALQGEEVAAMDISEDVAAQPPEASPLEQSMADGSIFAGSNVQTPGEGDELTKLIEAKLKTITEGDVDPTDWNAEAKAILGIDPSAPQMPDWGIPLAMIGLELMNPSQPTGSILGDIAEAGKKALPMFAATQQQRKAERMQIGKLAYELRAADKKTQTESTWKLIEMMQSNREYILKENKFNFEQKTKFADAITDLIKTVPDEARMDVMGLIPTFEAALYDMANPKNDQGVRTTDFSVKLNPEDIDKAHLWFSGMIGWGLENEFLDADMFKSLKGHKTQMVTFMKDGKAYKQLKTFDTRKGNIVWEWGDPVPENKAVGSFFTYNSDTNEFVSMTGSLEDMGPMYHGMMDKKLVAELNKMKVSTLDANRLGWNLIQTLQGKNASLAIPSGVSDLISFWEGIKEAGRTIFFNTTQTEALLNTGITNGSLTFNGNKVTSIDSLLEQSSLENVIGRIESNDSRSIQKGSRNHKILTNAVKILGDRADIYADILTLGFALANSREAGKLTDKDIALALRTVGFSENSTAIHPYEFSRGLVRGIANINSNYELKFSTMTGLKHTEGEKIGEPKKYNLSDDFEAFGIQDLRYYTNDPYGPEGSNSKNLDILLGYSVPNAAANVSLSEAANMAHGFTGAIPKEVINFLDKYPGAKGKDNMLLPYHDLSDEIQNDINRLDKVEKALFLKFYKEYKIYLDNL